MYTMIETFIQEYGLTAILILSFSNGLLVLHQVKYCCLWLVLGCMRLSNHITLCL